jgi:hypothetical protein
VISQQCCLGCAWCVAFKTAGAALSCLCRSRRMSSWQFLSKCCPEVHIHRNRCIGPLSSERCGHTFSKRERHASQWERRCWTE